MSKPKLINIGDFTVISGTLFCADPCYNQNEDAYFVKILNAHPGRWRGYALENTRITELICVHEKMITNIQSITPTDWEDTKQDIYVDSGQAGVFDAQTYRNDEVIDWEPEFMRGDPRGQHEPGNKWYRACCDVTLSDLGAGVLPGGAVAVSGWGDGVYPVYVLRNGSTVVGVRIVFIEDDEQ